MSNEENLFCTLPVELIYRIFGYLDAQTIVRSIRCVCKQLYTIVNTYDQFNFNFNSILKSDFLFLCNYIQPKNIISLTLSDNDQTPGQIQYFLSLFRLNQFTQLRSLTLVEIDDCYLNIILKDIKAFSLKSLTIHSERDYSQNNTTSDDFTSVISLLTLREFNLKIASFDISQIKWPVECRIQQLEIDCRTLNEYYNIVRHLPNLRVFIMGQLDEKINDGTILKPDDLEPFRQLSSLTLKYCNIDMLILEMVLSLAPSIEHFHLMRSLDLDDFTSHLSQWEKFVQTKLPLLNKFEFFLLDNRQFFVVTPVDTELLVNPFRTSFWIETKKWFVICDYIMSPRTIILYTPSLFDQEFEYIYYSKEISRSTSSSTIDNTIIMDRVKKMRLDLENVMPLVTSTQGGLPMNAVFPKVDELTLNIGGQWPLGSLRFLSTLIDLSHIVKLSLEIDNSFNSYSESTVNIDKLLKLAKNIHSLKIFIQRGYGGIHDHNMKIYSLVPNNVKHLTLRVSTVTQMQLIVRQLKYRSSIRFEYKHVYSDASEMHLDWLERENGYYTYRLNSSSICLWFDNHLNT